MGLRYLLFAIINYLRQFTLTHHDIEAARIESEDHAAVVLQVSLILFADVCQLVFRKTVEENRAIPGTVSDDSTEPAALSLAGPRHPLLNQPMPEIGVDQTTFGTGDNLAQSRVVEAILALEASKALRPRNSLRMVRGEPATNCRPPRLRVLCAWGLAADTLRPSKSHGCPMAIALRIAQNVGAALLAAAAMLLSGAPARASPGCNLNDIINDAANTLSAFTSNACLEASQIGEGAGYFLAGGIAAGLGYVQGNGGSQTISDLCNDVEGGQTDVGNLGDWLKAAGVDQQVTGDILAISGPVVSVLECGCMMEQGVSSLANDIGDCACDIANFFGAHCQNCTPPPPVQANCSLPTTCFSDSSDPNCNMTNTISGCLTVAGFQVCPGTENDTAAGAFVSTHIGDSECGALLYCFCPKPLVPTWTSVPPAPPGFTNPAAHGVFTCACPDGTRQVGTSGGIPLCLCDYTNVPPKVGDTPQEQCPINLTGPCKPDQIVIAGKCVTPCSDPTMGMTPDGACCDPNQVTSCGQCCPPGTRPVNGSCVGPGPIQ